MKPHEIDAALAPQPTDDLGEAVSREVTAYLLSVVRRDTEAIYDRLQAAGILASLITAGA